MRVIGVVSKNICGYNYKVYCDVCFMNSLNVIYFHFYNMIFIIDVEMLLV